MTRSGFEVKTLCRGSSLVPIHLIYMEKYEPVRLTGQVKTDKMTFMFPQ